MKIKIISVLLLLSITITLLPQPARAGAWGEDIYAAVLKQTLEEMYLKIKETVIANLKIQAIRVVQGRLQTLLGGATGGGMGTSGLVISDWRQFIYGSAQKYSTQITNDYFKSVGSGIPSALQQRVINPAKKSVLGDPTQIKPDLYKYVLEGKAENIFKPGATKNPWLAWNMAAMQQNNPAFYIGIGSGVQGESFRREEEVKKTEGTGSGMVGAKKDGKIVTPPAIIESIVAEIQNMPAKMLALARSLPEIVSSMVGQMINQMINQGIAQVTSKIDQQIINFRNQAGLPTNFLQQYIQSGGKTAPNNKYLPPSSLPSGWNRGGQD